MNKLAAAVAAAAVRGTSGCYRFESNERAEKSRSYIQFEMNVIIVQKSKSNAIVEALPYVFGFTNVLSAFTVCTSKTKHCYWTFVYCGVAVMRLSPLCIMFCAHFGFFCSSLCLAKVSIGCFILLQFSTATTAAAARFFLFRYLILLLI